MSLAQQDDAIQKDRERLQRKAEINVVRNLRLRDARWRTIGIEEQELRKQVLEKERLKKEEKEISRVDRLRNEEYDRILQAAADEEAYLRKLQNDELRKSWEESIKHKKDTSEPEIDTTPAAQNIGMEDRLRPERVKAQKEQMKRWAEEQAAANVRSRAREKDEDNAYADMIRAVDEIRGKADAEEAALRKKLQHDLAKENLELAELQRQKKLAERDPFTGEDAMNNTLPLYTEGGGGKDNFRGFNPEKRKEILKENERLIAFKKAMKDREREEEEAWHRERLLAARAMEQAELEDRQLREIMKEEQRLSLEEQVALRRQREEREKKNRDEPIGDGFFDGFGVIWR